MTRNDRFLSILKHAWPRNVNKGSLIAEGKTKEFTPTKQQIPKTFRENEKLLTIDLMEVWLTSYIPL